MKNKFGTEVQLERKDYAGLTDRLIGEAMVKRIGLESSEERIQQYLEGYLEALEGNVKLQEPKPLDGIITILEAAAERKDIVQGLLTGNVAKGAEVKLTHYKLWHFFEFGAFADDGHFRNELAPVAVERASQHAGLEIPASHTFVIGDTPHDVECGRAIGAQVIAVATGGYTKEELESHKPDALLDDLTDCEGFFALLEELSIKAPVA